MAPIIPALGKIRQDCFEFQASLTYKIKTLSKHTHQITTDNQHLLFDNLVLIIFFLFTNSNVKQPLH